MLTLNKKKLNYKLKKKVKLNKKPFVKGICLKVFTKTPKKPNSANRKVARLKLSNGTLITAYIPGEGHNLNQRSIVLTKKSKIKDLPGVMRKIIRNKYDCGPVLRRKTARSKYGKSKID